MSFSKLKKIRFENGKILSFDNYQIYMIPSNKLKLGISPLIDNFINKKLDLSMNCKVGAGVTIPNKYIYEILNKKDTMLFFVTKTVTSDEEIWEDEPLNEELIKKIETLDFKILKNKVFLNKLRNQLDLDPINLSVFKIKRGFSKKLNETIDKIREQMSNKYGGDFVSKTQTKEHLLSFMFIEKLSDMDYYVKVRCTTKFYPESEEDLPEYRFPWSTFLLYIFLKSMGNENINIYNDASGIDVIFYHKRFLFNLGKKKCNEEDEIYNNSLNIPFDILKGPDPINRRLLQDLIDYLPKDYKTKSGFKMKICDIQKDVNVAKLIDIENYLKSKWENTFKLDKIAISEKELKGRRLTRTQSLNSLLSPKTRTRSHITKQTKLNKKTNTVKQTKQTKKIKQTKLNKKTNTVKQRKQTKQS